ncbi:PASTA domain-containing protein [Brumimicrobium mesophilum]|uniref:PASTA domain-containing protein n=1 Tax=Brumimicrobium mesophilum TaxID=392717 RepID=UPI000D14212F|nr:PASTA domain-containing protein [Brumimicrobium mesophilum]
MGFFKKLGNFVISRKFIINFLLFGLVWFLIIWGGTTYFGAYTRHGETIHVPSLLNNNVKDIPKLIGDKDIKYEILDSIYNPDLVEGTIIYQNPMPTDSSGLFVKSDRVIRVRVSKRSRLVLVPIVVSKSHRFAEAVLMTKGLRTRVNFVPSNEDQGSVISQKFKGKSITSGQQVPINSVIELTVGKRTQGEMVSIPNLNGLTINEAQERFLGSSSLRLYAVYSGCETSKDSLQARVTRQTPVASDSSRIPEGSTITVFLSPEIGE